jgi:hypothetical protein
VKSGVEPTGTSVSSTIGPAYAARWRKRLALRLAGSSDVRGGDRRERDKLDGIDLDLTGPGPIAATLLDPWPLPQSDGEHVSRLDVVAQLAAELHARDASW